MKHHLFFISLFATIVLSNSCAAFEPPSTLAEDAIVKGNVAFIGRVVKLAEIADSDYESTAVADVELYQVFYGLAAKKGATNA
jgi:hypothetical protein